MMSESDGDESLGLRDGQFGVAPEPCIVPIRQTAQASSEFDQPAASDGQPKVSGDDEPTKISHGLFGHQRPCLRIAARVVLGVSLFGVSTSAGCAGSEPLSVMLSQDGGPAAPTPSVKPTPLPSTVISGPEELSPEERQRRIEQLSPDELFPNPWGPGMGDGIDTQDGRPE